MHRGVHKTKNSNKIWSLDILISYVETVVTVKGAGLISFTTHAQRYLLGVSSIFYKRLSCEVTKSCKVVRAP